MNIHSDSHLDLSPPPLSGLLGVLRPSRGLVSFFRGRISKSALATLLGLLGCLGPSLGTRAATCWGAPKNFLRWD